MEPIFTPDESSARVSKYFLQLITETGKKVQKIAESCIGWKVKLILLQKVLHNLKLRSQATGTPFSKKQIITKTKYAHISWYIVFQHDELIGLMIMFGNICCLVAFDIPQDTELENAIWFTQKKKWIFTPENA